MCINLECGNLAMETWEAMGVSATPSRLENHLPILRIFAHALLAEGMSLSQIHVYLTHCISKDYSANCEQSAPSSDQFCHSFWPMGRSNYSPGIFSPSPALYHGSQEPPCSVTVPSYINQKGCSWESWGEQTSASLLSCASLCSLIFPTQLTKMYPCQQVRTIPDHHPVTLLGTHQPWSPLQTPWIVLSQPSH